MSTSQYCLNISNAVYRDLGCPSQCMSTNEYNTISNYFSNTDPKFLLNKENLSLYNSSSNLPTNFSENIIINNVIVNPRTGEILY